MCHDYLKMDEGDTDIVGWWLSNQRGPDKPEARPVAEENKGDWGEKRERNRAGRRELEEPFRISGL